MDVPWRPGVAGEASVGELRASDADRERVVAMLREAHGDGRLAADEHEERIERAYAARTLGELAVVTVDLTGAEDQPVRVDPPRMNALFGSARRGGRWVMPVRLPVSALFGSVEIDLRDALLQRRHVVIDATMLCGGLSLLVPEGVRVEFTGRSVLGSRELRIRPRPGPNAPVVEVTGTVVLGSVRARTPKRRWRDRMRRRPARR